MWRLRNLQVHPYRRMLFDTSATDTILMTLWCPSSCLSVTSSRNKIQCPAIDRAGDVSSSFCWQNNCVPGTYSLVLFCCMFLHYR